MVTFAKDVAEAVTADDHAAVEFDAISKFCARVERDPRMEPTILSDVRAPPEETECFDIGTALDFHFVFNHHVGTDANSWGEIRSRCDDCRRMDFGRD